MERKGGWKKKKAKNWRKTGMETGTQRPEKKPLGGVKTN